MHYGAKILATCAANRPAAAPGRLAGPAVPALARVLPADISAADRTGPFRPAGFSGRGSGAAGSERGGPAFFGAAATHGAVVNPHASVGGLVILIQNSAAADSSFFSTPSRQICQPDDSSAWLTARSISALPKSARENASGWQKNSGALSVTWIRIFIFWILVWCLPGLEPGGVGLVAGTGAEGGSHRVAS